MRVAEEIVGVDDLGGEVEGVVVQQDRAEDGAFGFEIVRKRAFGDGGSGIARKVKEEGSLAENRTNEIGDQRTRAESPNPESLILDP